MEQLAQITYRDFYLVEVFWDPATNEVELVDKEREEPWSMRVPASALIWESLYEITKPEGELYVSSLYEFKRGKPEPLFIEDLLHQPWTIFQLGDKVYQFDLAPRVLQ